MTAPTIPMKTPRVNVSASNIAVVLALAILPACSVVKGPPAASDSAASVSARPGVCVENNDVLSLRKRLTALGKLGMSPTSYGYAKAQCWLDSAESQYFENDRTGYVAEGVEESAALIRAMEADRRAAGKIGDTKHIAASVRVRDDLWKSIADLKSQPGFECVAPGVACAEVRLVRGGHANVQTGWRQANPHIRIAEGLLAQAQSEIIVCNKALEEPAPREPTPTPTPVATPTNETFSLQADALFQFDRGDREHLLPAGKAKLDWLVTRLKEYQRIDKIDISGYTDRLGSDKYNLALSQKRADTVRNYLIAGGIRAGAMSAVGRGKSNTMGSRCPANMARKQLIDCLQRDRKVELSVLGIAKR